MKKKDHSENGFCEIKVKGRLGPHWAEWFDLMNVELESDTTTISGFIADQPELQGLMEKIRTLGLTIISINFGNGQNEAEK